MSHKDDSVYTLVELLKRKAPEYLDLMSAETEEEFDAAFDVLLERAVSHLEKNKKNFADLNEVGLSGALAGTLMMPGLTVIQEGHSNGHVDLTIEADHCTPKRTKLGEAKIYDGPEYHISGLVQLLGRYTTGREGRGLLISYVKKKDIKNLFTKLRTQMDTDLPLDQKGRAEDLKLKWSFLTKHGHDSGEDLQVGHIGCNLHVEQKK